MLNGVKLPFLLNIKIIGIIIQNINNYRGGHNMKFVKALCPSCNGILEVDKDKECAICNSCGTPFIVEKACLKNDEELENILKDAVLLLTTRNEFSDPLDKNKMFGLMGLNLPKIHRAGELFAKAKSISQRDWRIWFAQTIMSYLSKYDHHVIENFDTELYESYIPTEVAKKLGDKKIFRDKNEIQVELDKLKREQSHPIELMKKLEEYQNDLLNHQREIRDGREDNRRRVEEYNDYKKKYGWKIGVTVPAMNKPSLYSEDYFKKHEEFIELDKKRIAIQEKKINDEKNNYQKKIDEVQAEMDNYDNVKHIDYYINLLHDYCK